MLENIQNGPWANILYYSFHVLGFLAVFFFILWFGKKHDVSPRQSVITIIAVYSISYVWIYLQYWIESGFTEFGGNNIVRGFVYMPLIAWPVAKLLKISWGKLCDVMAPCVCIAQGISHIGCVFLGCCAGYPCEWGVYNYRYGGMAFPVQLFESATALAIVAFLIYHSKKHQYDTGGKAYPLMLILFGSTRFLWEFARNNEKIWLGCSSLAFHALFMVVVGIDVLITIADREEKTKRQVERRKKHIARRRAEK